MYHVLSSLVSYVDMLCAVCDEAINMKSIQHGNGNSQLRSNHMLDCDTEMIVCKISFNKVIVPIP